MNGPIERDFGLESGIRSDWTVWYYIRYQTFDVQENRTYCSLVWLITYWVSWFQWDLVWINNLIDNGRAIRYVFRLIMWYSRHPMIYSLKLIKIVSCETFKSEIFSWISSVVRTRQVCTVKMMAVSPRQYPLLNQWLVGICFAFLLQVAAYPNGAPTSTCDSMLPAHGLQSNDPCPFEILVNHVN